MATASVSNTFSGGAGAVPGDVNTNFSQLVSFLNTSVVHTDGSKAMSGALTLPAVPTSALQAATKSYVDQYAPTNVIANMVGGTTSTNQAISPTITITDPGYDIEVWGVMQLNCSPATPNDLSNAWEIQCKVNTVAQSRLRIPIVTNNQSLCSPLRRTVHTTGTNCVVSASVVRSGGSQASLTVATDSSMSFLDIWWRRKTP